MGLAMVDDRRMARELGAVAVGDAGPDDRGAALSRLIAPVVRHDALSLVGTDPASGFGLGSFSFWHAFEPGLVDALIMHRYLRGDPWRTGAIAGLRTPVGVVSTGDPSASPADALRAEVLAAHGARSELRLLLRDEHGVWGMLGLLRSDGSPPFGPADARRAALLGPALIATVRRYALTGPLVPSDPALPAGVITMGPDHRVKTVSPQAKAWLDLFRPDARKPLPLPDWIPVTFLTALSLSARALARRRLGSTPLVCAPPAVHGRWIVCQGQSLGSGDPGAGDIALVLQAAVGDLVLPPFCAWYGLTPRERDVIDELRTGAPTKQIARRLDLSAHTVNDHLKAVFRKTGAGGRDELIAALGQ